MRKYEGKILNSLLDRYEKSKSFTGANKNHQSFGRKITDLFPEYADEAQYELFSGVNGQVADLEKEGLVRVKRKKRGKQQTDVIASVALNTDRLGEAYRALGRRPKADRNEEILALLGKYEEATPLLSAFCKEQMERIGRNKKAQYSDDLGKLEQILKVLAEIENVGQETFIRNFSVKVLGDSKALEKIKPQVAAILCEYGGYTDKEHVFEDLNIIKNPGYVFVKGDGAITISGQVIDFRALEGDLGLSSTLLDKIERVEVFAPEVVTVENLTTFHSYESDAAFVIYLGGYHNSIRRKLIQRIYEDNPDKIYYHYGDIDAGGFHILTDLRAKTGIAFVPLHMDVATLEMYQDYAKRLTESDRRRLTIFLGGEFDPVVRYMLAHDCKLEQEAVH